MSAASAAPSWVPGPFYAIDDVPTAGLVPSFVLTPDGGTTVALNDAEGVAVAQRTPAGASSLSKQPLDPSAADATVAGAAVKAGDATLIPVTDTGSSAVRLATVEADGSAAPIRSVADGLSGLAGVVAIAADPSGDVVATWLASDRDDSNLLHLYARRLNSDGSSDPIRTLPRVDGNAEPQVAVAGDGSAVITWIGSDQTVQLARLAATGALDGQPQEVSNRGAPVSALVLASSATGVADVWVGSDGVVYATRLPRSGSVAETPTEVGDGVFSFPGVSSSFLAASLADDGTLTAAWVPEDLASVKFRRLAPDGSLSEPTDLDDEADVVIAPTLLPLGGGSLLAGWYHAGTGTLVVRRIAADGTPGTASNIDQHLVVTNPTDPTVVTGGVDDSGLITLGWDTAREGDENASIATATLDEIGPVVTADASATVQVGQPASFTATASDRSLPVTFRWDFGDRTNSDSPTITHAYTAPGTYAASVTATDTQGNQTVVQRTVTVTEPPAGGPPPGPGPGPAPGPGPVSARPTPTRFAAHLKLGKLVRKGARVRITGTLDRRASGRVTIVWSQEVGHKTIRARLTAKIVRGRFTATLKLPTRLARATTKATLTVTYKGDADTTSAKAHNTVGPPRRPVKHPKTATRRP